ncbi:hypothetical protein [Wolbachia pipientis]|uniref:hypothetical protein n=1 Tax=Wolbachia pipientis TaxID=955 RepID=UPI0025A3C0B6|nr:hypothetical protein [Wolbachia pipientis]MDM8335409.1 hypothetical protein [Wolbachia pipientis]
MSRGSTTSIPTSRTIVPEKNNNRGDVEMVLDTVIDKRFQERKNGSILIFNFDQTIVNSPMCNLFTSKSYNDYGSGQNNEVTKEKIEEFLQNSGIKNKEKLRSVLQSALLSGTEVVIVSPAYPKSVEYIVKNHLGLTEEQAQSIKVFEEATKRQTPRIEGPTTAEKMTMPQDPQIGKYLCVLYLLKAHKKDKGMFPQEVMLVDSNMRNVNPVVDFHRNINELLEKDMKSLLENVDQEIAEVNISEEELKNITFKGINISSEPATEANRAADDGYLDEVERWIEESTQNLQDTKNESGLETPLTPPPSYRSEDGSEKSLLSDGKRTNRTWPRVKYAMQQKGFIISSAGAIILLTSATLVYLQDKEKFVAFFTNSLIGITIPVIALATLLAVSPIFCAMKQFRNTKECQTQGRNADEILDKILGYQPKDKVIKSVRLEYSNGTHSNFTFNAWESKNDLINIDEKVISRTDKIESVINNRPLFTVLLTGVVAANITLPLGLLAIDGVNGVQKFYRNPLASDVGLSLLVSSGMLALLIVCLGTHYYNKTNCTNLVYSKKKINTERINEKFIKEIKRERTNVLGENHSKDAKRSSLTLEQVVVQSHNYLDVIYGVGG